jgi:hypothetical protein
LPDTNLWFFNTTTNLYIGLPQNIPGVPTSSQVSLTLKPVPNQFGGPATVTIKSYDPSLGTTTNFNVTVNFVPVPPTVSAPSVVPIIAGNSTATAIKSLLAA